MTLVLPPNYTNVPAHAMFDLSLPDPLLRTLGQFHGLAWQTKGEKTPPATVLEFAKVRGIKERQMYNHLRELKKQGLIRIQNLGDGRIIVFPLRWGNDRGAALSAEYSMISLKELATLADEVPDEANFPPEAATAENCSRTAKERHEHVVVHDSESDKQQHVHDRATAKNCSDELLDQMVAIFVDNGADRKAAEAKAVELLEAHGPEVCACQLAVFERRCDLARVGPRGLANPAGLFIASVRGNWDPPGNGAEPERKRWYTDEEFEQFFIH